MRVEDYKHAFKGAEDLEVVFPKELFEGKENKLLDDDFSNFENMLLDLNRQVSAVDGNVNNFVKIKNDLEKRSVQLELEKKALEDARFAFEQQMKVEHQKLEDLKIDFEQEKNRIFNDIQAERDLLEKNKRTFEKHRSEQLMLIEQNKKLLTKNYRQFENIVTSFNEKIDSFGAEN